MKFIFNKILLKKLAKLFLFLVFALLLVVVSCYTIVEIKTRKFVSDTLIDIPTTKVALVLGTGRNLDANTPNPFFFNRIKAAAKLYKAHKVKYLLLSGDNGSRTYNEPGNMRLELLKLGIPDSCMILDYAGFRTFDSMIRCKEIFGQTDIIVISQQFHNKRAIFIGLKYGIKAIGYNAKGAGFFNDTKVFGRELLARLKLFIDIYLINQKPKFLGEKILIP